MIRALTILALLLTALGLRARLGTSASSPLPMIRVPANYQVLQRTGSSGNIPISGFIQGSHIVQASFNGGTYVNLVTNPMGYFSVTLSNQVQGWGTLTVRMADATNIYTQISCGIGDVFVIAGQSNASGRATNNCYYNSPNGVLQATEFGNGGTWYPLVDPVDAGETPNLTITQIDVVSIDIGGTVAAGSVWPVMACYYATNVGIPVAYIPCALGGTSITQWLPQGVSHFDHQTLYGSMVDRVLQAAPNGIRAVLWWQGETDMQNSMASNTYYADLTLLATNINTDLSAILMPCTVAQGSAFTTNQWNAIDSAITNAWATCAFVTNGPELRDLVYDLSGYHFATSNDTAIVGMRWWQTVSNVFGLP